MARCRFGNLAAFQWKCAAAPAQRQFGDSAVFVADMLFSMQKPRVSKRKIKSAEALPKNLNQIPCFLVGGHWRFFGLLACLRAREEK